MSTYPIKYITDKEGNRVLPKTAVNAVVDEQGTPLSTIIENIDLPDEEDLTKDNNGKLKFKDRPNTDGMGRIILRKNMVSGVNTLTQSMINQANTVYVIQYDFTLGEDITLPANCVLEFDGGSISGAYTVTGANTGIQAGLVKIFNTNVIFAGSWKVEYSHPEWFGATGDGSSDDTDSFYAALSNFNNIFISGRYSVDFRDITLSNKILVGKWRHRSAIVQRNSNVPFAYVGQYNRMENFVFSVKNNTQITDILHFGYQNNSFLNFGNTKIANLAFSGKEDDDKTIFLHFNMKEGGSANFFMENLFMNNCYMGIWFEFNPSSNPYGWLTNSIVKNVTILNPSYYGFKWDALTVYKATGETERPMWCYGNFFENISITLNRNNSTGFYIGQGMSNLINPTVYNDIINGQHGATSSSVGYAIEFAPILSPIKPKMVTNIAGGFMEGRVKNIDFAYMNNISNLKLTLRNIKSSGGNDITLDSNSIQDAYDLNIFGSNVYTRYSVTNATISVGYDKFGKYLKITRTNASEAASFNLSISKTALTSGTGIVNGKYTLQSVAESNLGDNTSGFYVSSEYSSQYLYEIDNHVNESRVFGEDSERHCVSYFLNVTDDVTGSLVFGYNMAANDGKEYIKIYGLRLIPGIVGTYLMEKPFVFEKEPIVYRQSVTYSSKTLFVEAQYDSVDSAYSGTSIPKVTIFNDVPAGTAGTEIQLGTLDKIKLYTRIIVPVFQKAGGANIGREAGKIRIDATKEIYFIPALENESVSVIGSL